MNLSISFGALAEPIKAQVEAAGLCISKKDAKLFQLDAEAVTRCCIRGLIGESVAAKARQRILKNLARAVSKPATETDQ